jgi:hypothetical protein
MEKLGYLYKKHSDKAGTYFSGKFGNKAIVVFINNKKRSPYDPDWLIYEGKGRPEDYRSPFDRDPGEK